MIINKIRIDYDLGCLDLSCGGTQLFIEANRPCQNEIQLALSTMPNGARVTFQELASAIGELILKKNGEANAWKHD